MPWWGWTVAAWAGLSLAVAVGFVVAQRTAKRRPPSVEEPDGAPDEVPDAAGDDPGGDRCRPGPPAGG